MTHTYTPSLSHTYTHAQKHTHKHRTHTCTYTHTHTHTLSNTHIYIHIHTQGSSDNSARYWAISTGEALNVFNGHHKSVVSVCLLDSSPVAWRRSSGCSVSECVAVCYALAWNKSFAHSAGACSRRILYSCIRRCALELNITYSLDGPARAQVLISSKNDRGRRTARMYGKMTSMRNMQKRNVWVGGR